MGIKRNDPRTEDQKKADEKLRAALENGTCPRASDSDRKKAIQLIERKKEARQEAAKLGIELVALRRCFGITQKELAGAIGTQHSDISRIERGDYGGLTIERFLLILARISEMSNIDLETFFFKSASQPVCPTISIYDPVVYDLEKSECVTRRE